jgi:hypothetical protein
MSHVTRHTSHVKRHTSHTTLARWFTCAWVASVSLLRRTALMSTVPLMLLPLLFGNIRPDTNPANYSDVNASHHTHTSHVTRHTSHVTRHTSHVTLRTSHVTRHTSHVTRHTSHVTRHTSHVTRHTPPGHANNVESNSHESVALPSRRTALPARICRGNERGLGFQVVWCSRLIGSDYFEQRLNSVA